MKLKVALLTLLLVGWAVPALGQGCAMCYSSAQATSKEGQKAINKGVLVLLFPPTGFMTLGIWMAVRYAKRRDLERSESLEKECAVILSAAKDLN